MKKDLLVRQERLVLQAREGLLVLLVGLVFLAALEESGLLDQRARKENQEKKDLQALLDRMENRGLSVYQELLDLKVHLETMVIRERLEVQDRKEAKETKETRDLQDQ